MRRVMKNHSGTVNIPMDIIITILSLLSIETLVRFMCVSKRWNALIQSSLFTSMHRSAHAADKLIYLIVKHPTSVFSWHTFFDRADSLDSSSLLKFSPGHDINFHGSCDGLVLYSLKDYRSKPPADRDRSSLLIWNPSSGKRKAIGICTYDKLVNDLSYGFGSCELDGRVDDYKAVLFSTQMHRYKALVVYVYTLSTRSWKRVDVDAASSNFNLRQQLSVSINGIVYWFGRRYSAATEDKRGVIISFDLQREVFGEIALPQGSDVLDKDIRWIVGNYRQCLSLVSHNLKSRKLSAWVRKEYGADAESCWEELFVISIPPSLVVISCFGSRVLMMCGSSYNHVVFDTESQQLIQLGDNARYLENLPFKAIAYNESLVSLDGKWWR